MTTTEATAVLAANAAFYQTMRLGDFRSMDLLWSRRRRVSCTHPGAPTIQGRAAVMASWRRILGPRRALPIQGLDPHAIVTGGSALVLCREELGDAQMMTSNCFIREAGVWRMLSHHAAELPRRK